MKKIIYLFLALVVILALIQLSGVFDFMEFLENDKEQIEIESTSEEAKENHTVSPTVPTSEKKLTYGLDISNYQGDKIDILNKRADDLSFVICKATEGVTYTDPHFRRNWKTIPEMGIIRGAYHTFRSKDDPIQQAENYLNAIDDLGNSDLPPIVDFIGVGIDKSQPVEEVQNSLILFLDRLIQEMDRVPIIYVDKLIGDTYLDGPNFSKYPLWIASYEAEMTPRLPSAWVESKWTFWQKSNNVRIDSQKNDLDCFNGNIEELMDFINRG